MPIYCNELEKLLENWKMDPKESHFAQELYIKKKAKELIDNLSLDDIIIQEELTTSRTHSKLRLVKNINLNVKPRSRL